VWRGGVAAISERSNLEANDDESFAGRCASAGRRRACTETEYGSNAILALRGRRLSGPFQGFLGETLQRRAA